MHYIFIVAGIFGILSLSFNTVFSAACTKKTDFGKNNPNSDTDLGNSNMYYLVPAHSFSCCGVITKWEYRAENTGTVELQVWRPVVPGGTDYRLVSSYSHTATKKGDVDVTPTLSNLVKDGDVVGWSVGADDVIGYKNGGTQVDAFYQVLASTDGDIDWSGATTQTGEWGIGGEINSPSSPTFSGPSTGSVADSETAGTTVLTVTFADSDITDELSLTMSHPYFDLIDNGDKTGTIEVGSNSLTDISGTTQTLSITATDLCGLTVTGTVTITVTNIPPVLTNPATVSISEDVYVETDLITFECSDSSTVTTSVDWSDFFFTTPTGNANEYKMVALSQTGSSKIFSYNDKNSYEVTISCCDNSECVTGVIIVTLIQNTPPTIDNLADGTSANVLAADTVGTKVYTVDFSDAESDTVRFWSYCAGLPASAPCCFEALNSGDVIKNSECDSTVAAYDLIIGVEDHRNNGTFKTLSILVTGNNNAPTFLNMNNSVIVNDGQAINTNIFNVSASDPDADTLFFQMSEENGGTSYFAIDSDTGEITTSAEIDYDTILMTEGTSAFLFKVVVSDGKGGTATATLSLTLQDANEPFTFANPLHLPEILEWAPVGSSVDVVFTILDGDYGDTHTCTMNCTIQGYFQISQTCNITVSALWRLDLGSLPTSNTCTVTATDTGGLNGSTTVIITINYDNNYTPTFSSNSYDFSVSTTDVANTAIGSVSASDDDLVSYNTFSYSFNLTDPPAYFKIDSSTGEIKTKKSMNTYDCAVHQCTFPVFATDTGGLVGTSIVQITIIETSATEEDRFKTFFDDTRNIWWFSIMMVVLAITFVVTIFVCFKYVFMQPCKSPLGKRRGWRPYRPSSPKTLRKPPQETQLKVVRNHPPAEKGWKQYNKYY